MQYDVAIIGGGIVGLATAMRLLARRPGLQVVLLEKETELASHQTGHNSGVVHSGIYYRPGSLKAEFAKAGNRRLMAFCGEQGIPLRACGKIIVATNPVELPRLETLYHRGIENGLAVSKLSRQDVLRVEPHCTAEAGILVPTTGIVDYKMVARAYANLFQDTGGHIAVGRRVEAIEQTSEELRLQTGWETTRAKFLINCGGLQSDRIARLCGLDPGVRIVPVRGEYYMVRPAKQDLVNGLIYPVPNPAYPFLGVHLTRTITGGLHAGPNAVLTLHREGYGKWRLSPRDARDLLRSGAFWRFIAHNWAEGCRELTRSLSKRLFAKSLQRMVPAIGAGDLYDPHAGIRAQALDQQGGLVDDFAIVAGPRSLHVCNAPSPAATASLCIGDYIVDRFLEQHAA